MFLENRPKPKLEKSNFDYLIEYATFSLIAISFGYAIYFYGSLPEQVPMHFNASGEVDRYGSKASIWALYLIGFGTVIGMFYLNKFPHIFNYPKKITEDNAKKYYSDATRMLRYLNFGIAILFATIGYEIVNIALDSSKGFTAMSHYILITIIVTMIIFPMVYVIKNLDKKSV
jgi:uncharacterized membrane protein